jgi:uncharacterized membrane protein
VFETVTGIPAHPLLVHAAVVLVPLLALFSVGYAVVPKLRDRFGWVVASLAIVTPLSTLASKLSGEAFEKRLAAKGIDSEILAKVQTHGSFGSLTFWAVLALAVASLLLVIGVRRGVLPQLAQIAGAAVVVALALVSAYYVFRTGDSGAHIVWNGL